MADSVFYDLAETPEAAANLTARGLLMIAIEQRIREEDWTQTEAAARLQVTQPRISDLLNGKISKFSLDALVNMLPPVGLTSRSDRSNVHKCARRRRPSAKRSAGVDQRKQARCGTLSLKFRSEAGISHSRSVACIRSTIRRDSLRWHK